MSSLSMYFILMLDNIRGVFGFLSFLSVSNFVLFLICYFFMLEKIDKVPELYINTVKKYFKRITLVSILFVMIHTFTPTTKQMAAIIVIPSVVNNENVQRFSNGLGELSMLWLQDLKSKYEVVDNQGEN